ncbi:hypothetical protein [Phaffia rhodozyma]|uniref:alpha-1,6-mannosyl-glycoprotein 6-beta-N-acetylglucosaminyltransferase n=1 Tax=Phaffia rhodozyma TaxID=264483 RepID=A0A0F7SVS9_PHARH|nr:hypothetical protein [Phaffia rhodozyma]
MLFSRQNKKGICYIILPYTLFCLLCVVFSLRSKLFRRRNVPAWALQPPLSYAPSLPPPRHPSIAHLTPLQKTHLVNLSDNPPEPSPNDQFKPWKARNAQTFISLHKCVMDPERLCENTSKGKVVILEADYFRWSLGGGNDGEHIWASSVLTAFDSLGYTVLISESAEETNEWYSGLSGAVTTVIKTRDEVDKCVEDSRWGSKGSCLEGPDNTRGIPIWKIFSMYFFPTPAHPLGSAWTLSPEPYHYHSQINTEARYLGYSIEKVCLKEPVVPWEKRDDRAYMFAKFDSYLTNSEATWSTSSFPTIQRLVNVTFVGGFMRQHGNRADSPPQIEGITNLGLLDREDFIQEMAKSKVLVGVGNPIISPTPYEALCLGVPFINPIRQWDHDDPEDRDKWVTQHNGLIELNPPHVYHVRQHDEKALGEAIHQAMNAPIDRYILPRMREEGVKERVKRMVEDVDWWKKWRALPGVHN